MVAAARRFAPWSDLQPELLGLVLRRLSSLADRIRVRSVCRSWRRGALLEPSLPPPLPWLTLPDGTFLSIANGGEIHRVPVQGEDTYRRHGSVGNWLFHTYADRKRCSLTNPFSGTVLRLPKVGIIWGYEREVYDDAGQMRSAVYLKLLPLAPPSPSPGSRFALLVMDNKLDSTVSIWQPTTAAAAFTVPDHRFMLDIAFYDGRLYGLSHGNKLFLFDTDDDLSSSDQDKPPARILSMRCLVNSMAKDVSGTAARSFVDKGYECRTWGYLVESSGRLLYVRRLLGLLSTLPDDSLINKIEVARTLWFDVFEADLVAIGSGCGAGWRRVKTLRGQALFVGTHSRSLSAHECGAQEDCVYFMRDYDRGSPDPDPLRDSGVFNIRDGSFRPLLPDTSVVPPTQGAVGVPAWFFPDEAM